jgi:16S rRNA (cytosine1402-N4)-methyltransferase
MLAVSHTPVLVAKVVDALAVRPGGVYLDATVGPGGHAAAILRHAEAVRLVGLDVDGDALAAAHRHLAPWAASVSLVRASYRDLRACVSSLGIDRVDGVLFDLGVSSLQLDTPERGFSFRHEAPLDMRFSQQGPTATELLASLGEEELMRILEQYGEERRARRVARAIVRAREHAPIRTTGELHRVVLQALGRGHGRIDPATRTFQALRIATNRELEGLPAAIEDAAHMIRPLGRLAVIAFHSLEDRLVKRTFRRLSGRCVCPPGTEICHCRPASILAVLTRKPLRPSEEEVEANPRARSAKLRVAERRAP